MNAFNSFLSSFGRGVGKVVSIFYQAGREAVEMIIKNVLPFLAFVAVVVGVMNGTGLGTLIANWLVPLAGSLVGLLVLCLIIGLPVLSPLLGPGAVIAQIIGTLLGTYFASKHLPLATALPALFAINPQVGCDFIPVGLSLGEAEPETVEVGVPAILFSRFITGPIAVILGWIASTGM